MKTIIKLLTSTLIFGLFFTACLPDKEEELTTEEKTEQMIISSEDHANSEDFYQDIEDRVDEAIEKSGGGGDCPTVSASPDWQTYPRTITIDFGEGCEGPRGRTRKGKIVVEVTDNIFNVNAKRTATLIDFSIDGIEIEGTRTLKNEGYDADGNITISKLVTDGKITFLNGDVATWETDVLLTQTAGGTTPFNLFDNVFEITGNSSGINRNGKAYLVNIKKALVKDKICPWLVSGVLTLTVDNLDVSLDYGDGACDRKAVLTLPNGTEHEILIWN